MSDDYELQFSQPAHEQLESLPLSIRDEVDRALDRLARSPTSVSVRSAFPYREDRQLYHFSVRDFTNKRWHFVVHFRYARDEQSLVVIALSVHEP